MSLHRYVEDALEPDFAPDTYDRDEIENLIEELDPLFMFQRRPVSRRAAVWQRKH
jgi:hypothetical protein